MNAKELLGRLEPHVGLASSLAGALGFGSVMALATDAGEMFVEHTGAATLLAAAALSLGFALSEAASGHGARARRRRALDALRRTFATMSPRRRRLVARALDSGCVSLSSHDPDAAELCRLGILRAPALLAETLPNDFAVNPAVVLEVREHREEWLGL